MKMTNLTARWLAIMLAIVAPLLYAGYLHYQQNNFSCEGHLIIVENGAWIDTVMTFSFHNGTGDYDSTGEYRQAGQSPITVSNKVAFRFWREDERVILISSDTNELPKKDEAYRHYIPDFFHHRDRGLSLEIIPMNASSYLFRFGSSPVFYCTKN